MIKTNWWHLWVQQLKHARGPVRLGLIRLCCLLSLLLAAQVGQAQVEKRAPVREKTANKATMPTQESKANPLSPKQLEEALRLLLAATADSATTQPQRTLEISGLVVDQTISKIGRDFYNLFYTRFEAPAGTTEYVVSIEEKPARLNSTLVLISANGEDLLEMPLQPKYEYLEAAADEAIGTVTNYLLEAASVSNQLENGAREPLETF